MKLQFLGVALGKDAQQKGGLCWAAPLFSLQSVNSFGLYWEAFVYENCYETFCIQVEQHQELKARRRAAYSNPVCLPWEKRERSEAPPL